MTEPESAWRVRAGAGLLSAAPMNPELREAHQREDAAEAEKAKAEAEAQEQLEFERVKEREFFGGQARTVADVLVEAAVGAQAENVRAGEYTLAEALDIEDRRERKHDESVERKAAEVLGRRKPPPRYIGLLANAAAEREAKAAAPATVGAVEKAIAQVKATVGNTIGRLIP